jgi:hypothetical protein
MGCDFTSSAIVVRVTPSNSFRGKGMLSGRISHILLLDISHESPPTCVRFRSRTCVTRPLGRMGPPATMIMPHEDEKVAPRRA